MIYPCFECSSYIRSSTTSMYNENGKWAKKSTIPDFFIRNFKLEAKKIRHLSARPNIMSKLMHKLHVLDICHQRVCIFISFSLFNEIKNFPEKSCAICIQTVHANVHTSTHQHTRAHKMQTPFIHFICKNYLIIFPRGKNYVSISV